MTVETTQRPTVLELLRSSALFGSIPEEELTRIAPRLRLERFARGDTVIREGDEGDTAYLVASGEAAVVTHDLIGEEIVLKVFKTGEGFGETALVDKVRRTATIKAQTDLEAYVLDRATFEELQQSAPGFAASVKQYVDLLGVDRVLKKASPFARLPADRIRKLAGQLVPVHAPKGTDVVTEGDEGDRFYLIRAGKFDVIQGTRKVAELGPGEFFGEIALISGEKRIATVRAAEDGDLFALDKEHFDAIIKENTGIAAQMFELGRLRFRATTGQALSTPDPITTLMPYLDEKRRDRYWKVLLAGLAVFAAASYATIQLGIPIAIVLALVLGSFLVPIVYVVYLVESDVLATRPGSVVLTFILAALLGIPISGVIQVVLGLDPNTIQGSIGIAILEEILKLLGVLWLLGRSTARFRMDGVVFGAAAGMGFAAFETLLFGWAYVDNADLLLKTVGVRSILAPLGHGTWTAIVCAVLWSERGRGRLLTKSVLLALGVAVALHATWDWQPLATYFPEYAIPANIAWFLAVGAVGVLALRMLVHRATTEELSSIVALNPELASPRAKEGPRIECHRCKQIGPAGAHYCVRCGAALRRRAPAAAAGGRSERAAAAS